MSLRLLCTLLVLLPVSTLAAGVVVQAPERAERVTASFLLARGRLPTNVEVEEWAATGASGLTDLMSRHREQLQADPSAQQAVIHAAARDAFGLSSGERENTAVAALTGTYTELLQRHLERLRRHPSEYEQVVRRAYRFVLHRGPYDLEFEYWQKHHTLTWVLLAGCIEDWARRNQPGLMVTAGTPTISVTSRAVTVVRLSPSLVAEAREVAGLPPQSDAVLASGRTVVAVGADDIVSSRAMPLIVVGLAP